MPLVLSQNSSIFSSVSPEKLIPFHGKNIQREFFRDVVFKLVRLFLIKVNFISDRWFVFRLCFAISPWVHLWRNNACNFLKKQKFSPGDIQWTHNFPTLELMELWIDLLDDVISYQWIFFWAAINLWTVPIKKRLQ